MDTHVVFGAGPVGRAVAGELNGDRVVLVSRSGAGPEIPGVTRVAADVSDPGSVAELVHGATTIYNCLNPAYHRWEQDWPPMAEALLRAAQSSDAVLVTVSNLYGYGEVTGPITEDLPLATTGKKGSVRVKMYQDALAAHRDGRVRMVEIRAADYIGPGAQSHLGARTVPRLLAGKVVRVLGDPDQPHTWTYTRDVARLAVVVGRREDAWGRAWHVPSNVPRTQRQALGDFAEAAGVDLPNVKSVSPALLAVMGIFSPMIRELNETRHQLTRPFVLDSQAASAQFDMEPTAWPEVIADTLRSFGVEPVIPAQATTLGA